MNSVSIVIPAWNEALALSMTFDSLNEMDYDKSVCEIIIIAGGSDGTDSIAQEICKKKSRFKKCIFLEQQPGGKNKAIRMGLKEITGEIVLLLDADTTLDRGCLKQLVALLAHDECDLAIANPFPIKRSWVSDYYMIIKSCFLEKISTYSGNAMAFKAEKVNSRIDYFFDTNVLVGVDYFLMKRFLEEGYRIRFAQNAIVFTHMPSSLSFFLLTEMRWLTALIQIGGVNYRNALANLAVVSITASTPFLSGVFFMLALMFHLIFIAKRAGIFFAGKQWYRVDNKSLVGFISLSYMYHMIGLSSYVRYFLGLAGKNRLYQGERT